METAIYKAVFDSSIIDNEKDYMDKIERFYSNSVESRIDNHLFVLDKIKRKYGIDFIKLGESEFDEYTKITFDLSENTEKSIFQLVDNENVQIFYSDFFESYPNTEIRPKLCLIYNKKKDSYHSNMFFLQELVLIEKGIDLNSCTKQERCDYFDALYQFNKWLKELGY